MTLRAHASQPSAAAALPQDARTAGTPPATRRSGILGAGGRRAFVVEAMLLLAFLGFALALVLQLFAVSSNMSRQAHALSMMCQLADDTAQRILGSQLPAQDQELFFDADGAPCGQDKATYRVTVQQGATPAAGTPGQLVDLHVQASALDQPGLEPFSLATQQCVSLAGAYSSAASGGSA